VIVFSEEILLAFRTDVFLMTDACLQFCISDLFWWWMYLLLVLVFTLNCNHMGCYACCTSKLKQVLYFRKWVLVLFQLKENYFS